MIGLILLMNGKVGLGRRERPYHSHHRSRGGFNKSSTTVNLPGITPASHHSTYLETIGGMEQKVEYESKNTTYITREQSKLKGVLRKLNDDTLHLIDLIKPHKNTHSSPQQAHKVAQKQLDNRKKVIDHLQHDIKSLEQQYQRLSGHQSHSELTTLKRQIRGQIQRTTVQNTQLKLEIQKQGNHLTHGPNQNIVGLQIDVALALQRLDRLKAEQERVKQDGDRLEKLLQQLQPKLQVFGVRNQAIQGAAKQEKAEKEREKNYLTKKTHFTAVKKKIDLIQSSNQYRYYKLLRELDAESTKVTQIETKTTATQHQLAESKRILQLLEHQLAQVKEQQRRKNQMVMDYLAQSRTRTHPSPPDSPMVGHKQPALKESRGKEEELENVSMSIKEEKPSAKQEEQEADKVSIEEKVQPQGGVVSKVEIDLEGGSIIP